MGPRSALQEQTKGPERLRLGELAEEGSGRGGGD